MPFKLATFKPPHGQMWRFHPLVFHAEAFLARRQGRRGGPKPVKVLLVSDGVAFTSEQQFAPVRRHAAALRERLGVVFQHRLLAEAMTLTPRALSCFDVVGLKLSFRTPRAEVDRVAAHFKAAMNGQAGRLVYFDGDDDLCVQWPQLLDAVDLYVKKHLFADRADYMKRYVGKSNLTDYIATHHAVSFDADPVRASGGLDGTRVDKLHLGWNIALDDKIAGLRAMLDPAAPHRTRGKGNGKGPAGEAMTRPAHKDVDISCRAAVPPTTWTYPLRNRAVEQLEAMAGRFRVLSPRDRVSQAQYYEEMLRSRICVSPFGYGELCWRDFEAILCGCLLVKPDMSHLRTRPDLFVPHVTYVPVRWDFSDLQEQCARYLENEPQRRRIADAALKALESALEERSFVDLFGDLLARLGLPAPAQPQRSGR